MAGLTTQIEAAGQSKSRTLPDFARLVGDNQGMVYSIAYHFLGDSAQAEDLAQEVFLQLHRNLERLESEEHVKRWLRKVAAHRAIDFTRRHHPVEVALDMAPEPAGKSEMPDPFLNERLRKLVISLPEKVRVLIILRYQEDMTPEEIAATLGMRVTTVRSRLFRTLEHLRRKASELVGKG